MEYKFLGRTNLKVSRIGLGTAEIGFEYGIGPRPLPTENEAIALLKSAVDMGINFFDTANIHKLSDERIAKSGIARIPGIIIATKCARFLEKGENPERSEMEKRIRQEVEINLMNLKLDVLTILQLHGGSKDQIENGALIEIMQKLKDEGKIQFVGISTRGQEASLAAIESGFFDVIQVAYSVLDQRMDKLVFPTAQAKRIGVINRSVLLKGALTSLVEKLSVDLEPLKINSRKVREIAKGLDLTQAGLAIWFVLSNCAISVSLIGTNKLGHLKNAVKLAEKEQLSEKILADLKNLAIGDPKQVDPANWSLKAG